MSFNIRYNWFFYFSVVHFPKKKKMMVKTLSIPTSPINQTNYRILTTRTSTRHSLSPENHRNPVSTFLHPIQWNHAEERERKKNWKKEKEISQMIVYQNNGSGTMAAHKSAFTYDPFLISAFLKTSPPSAAG